jgi:two-component system chemotaxis response regulator CheY
MDMTDKPENAMKILVVDDDIVSRMVLMHLVDSCGTYEICEAGDGEQAWEQLRGGLRPAVCFCDLRMPRLSGMELLARVKTDPDLAAMRFVLASSANDNATMAQASSLGACGYIVKPFDRDQVLAQLSAQAPRAPASVAEDENPLATMQRLGIAGDRLLLYLGGFDSQLAAAGAELAPLADAGEHGQLCARVERVRAGCVTLGLHGAAARLDLLSARPAGSELQAALAATLAAVRAQSARVRRMLEPA